MGMRLGGLQIWCEHFGEEKILFLSQSSPSVRIILTGLSCILIMSFECSKFQGVHVPLGLVKSCSSGQEISTLNGSQRFIIIFIRSGCKVEGSKVVPVFHTLKANGGE